MTSHIEKFTKARNVIRVTRESEIPLVGCIAYGLIDRGTNLIQVRPISTCPLSCIFCSTDAGPKSRRRQTEYIVDLDYLVEGFYEIVKYKGPYRIEAHIDTVGDPLTYPRIVDLVHELSDINGVEVISMQTHGLLLNENLIEQLDDAGLSRLNLSIDAMDPELAKKLSNTEYYDVTRILELAEYISRNTNIDLLIAPVWVPGYNDKEIPRIIEFALKIGAGKKWPPLGIQKYVPHKRGRKPKNVKPLSWRKFYRVLKDWEKKYGVKLILSPEDFGIHKRKMLPTPFKIGQVVEAKIVATGWLKGETIAAAKGYAITIVGSPPLNIGEKISARIIKNKHNIFIGRLH